MNHELSLQNLSINTSLLLCAVTFGILILGGGLAWLTTQYQFTGRKLFSHLLLLPLAMPAYILGLLLAGIMSDNPLDAMSAVNDTLMSNSDFTLLKTSLLYIATLYPLVYIPAKNAFSGLTQQQQEMCCMLGLSQSEIFFQILLPKAKPGMIAGLLLALLIVLSDFATPALTGFPTLTSSIYLNWDQSTGLGKAWMPATALMLIALSTFLLLQLLRGNSLSGNTANIGKIHQQHISLDGFAGVIASLSCALLLLFTVLLPVMQLTTWFLRGATDINIQSLLPYLSHSFILAFAVGLATLIAVFIMMISFRSSHQVKTLSWLSSFFNAMPMPFLAIVILVILQGLPALILVYIILVFPIASGLMQSALKQNTPGFKNLSLSLELPMLKKIQMIYLPMMRSDFGIAALMMVVIIFRELPASYFLQSAGWETLAAECFRLVSSGANEQAALAASVLILTGLLPIILLTRKPSTLSRVV